jgi:hypothetical protein
MRSGEGFMAVLLTVLHTLRITGTTSDGMIWHVVSQIFCKKSDQPGLGSQVREGIVGDSGLKRGTSAGVFT